MKSIAIVGGLCCLFIIISVFTRSIRPIDQAMQIQQCQTTTSMFQTTALKTKKSKNSAMPRWHRVIPGMFR